MVLPFLLIGKALKPLAKIKKQAWKQMGTAFGSIQSAVDPMKSFAKIFEVISVIMLPLTFIMTLLASVILNQLMPYIAALITYIDELGDTLEASAAEVDYLSLMWEGWMYQNEMIFMSMETLFYYLFIWRGHIEFLNDAADRLIVSLEGVIDVFEEIADAIEDLFGGGGGGGDGDGWEWPEFEWGTGPIGGSTNSTSNTVNINLNNSVIDDRAALVRDIVEQVIIRIG